jgi:hypothetical protein
MAIRVACLTWLRSLVGGRWLECGQVSSSSRASCISETAAAARHR